MLQSEQPQNQLRPRRPCRPHERPWRDRCVDIHLEDRWLESLNSLLTFDLVSICEGHTAEGSNRNAKPPHINLRLKDDLLASTIRELDHRGQDLQHQLRELFHDTHTSAELEFRIQIRTSNRRDNLDLRVRAIEQPVRDGMDETKRDWFENVVRNLQSFDNDFPEIIGILRNIGP